MGLSFRASGRSTTLVNTTITPVSSPRKYWPIPNSVPIAAEHQIVAAVFRPCTYTPSLKITPAPRNPIPETICPAMRACESRLLVSAAAEMTKAAAPAATKAFVRVPATRWWNCRSRPTAAPTKRAEPILRIRSISWLPVLKPVMVTQLLASSLAPRLASYPSSRPLLQELCHQACPPGLVTGAQPGAIVGMEVFHEKHVIAEMRVVLEQLLAVVYWPLAVCPRLEKRTQPRRKTICRFIEGNALA